VFGFLGWTLWRLIFGGVALQQALGAKQNPQHSESKIWQWIFPWYGRFVPWERLFNEFDTADRKGNFNGLDVSSEGMMKSS